MKKIFTILTTLILSITLFSCMTIKEIPEDKSAVQILQMGQNATTSGNYQNAELCFNTVLERYGSNPVYFTQATYELGHMYKKQNKFDKAKVCFYDILTLAEKTPGLVQPKYVKLCKLELNDIEKKLSSNSK